MAGFDAWQGRKSVLAIAAIALALVSCVSGPPSAGAEKTATAAPALNASPKIGDFVLYAERSVTLGVSDTIDDGDVGVRSAGELSDVDGVTATPPF